MTKVSACIITYNNEAFIASCIEGALAQACTMDYEIVIGHDNSTDETLSICLKYQKKFPELIKIIARDKNIVIMGN